MDIQSIELEIQDEVKEIVKLLGTIQCELDDLNTLTEPNGTLDKAVKEGVESMENLAKRNGLTLDNETIEKVLKIQQIVDVDMSFRDDPSHINHETFRDTEESMEE